MPAAPVERTSRHARQLALPQVGPEGQERLRGASVLIAGLGGLGSPLAQYLAAAGVGRLGLLDSDLVEESNLQRQVLYATADLGRPKAEAAAERLRGLDPEVEAVPLRARLDASNAAALVRGWDLVADGTDNFPSRYALNDACAAARKPLVHGAVYRFSGQVAVFWAGRGPCYRCLHPRPPASVPSCAQAGVLGALVGAVGSLQALESLKVLLGAGRPCVGRLLVLDGLDLTCRTLTVERDPSCAACGTGRRDPKEERMNAVAEITVEDLKARLDRKEPVQLLDVREPDEHQTARIEGALLMPLRTLPQRHAELDPSREVVVHCHHGGRSARAAEYLASQGYKASNLAGGIDAWSERIDPSVPRY